MAPPISRRDFIRAAAGVATWPLLQGCSSDGASAGVAVDPRRLPDPGQSGIDHVVVVMMENRSFDHMLGWVPGADGRQDGFSFPDKNGVPQFTHRLSPDFAGCGLEDPHHGYGSGRVHYNNGAMDGFLQETEPGDLFPIGYYSADDLPFYKGCAAHWTICDRYHSGILASTQANRVYMHCGQTDRRSNDADPVTGLPKTCSLPTLWDAAAEAGIRAGYFFGNLPLTALWMDKYLAISKPYELFEAVCAAGQLPNITYVDPFFYQAGFDPLCNDDHPHADVRNGQAFLNRIYDALRRAPTWERTLLVINYDEWGGFYDHVPPPVMPVSEREATNVNNDGRLGFRVPCVLIGPRVRRGHVEHTLFEPNSILKFMEWRWNLRPLGVRSATTNNLALALDFDQPANPDAPAFDVPAGPFGDPFCEQSLPGLPGISASMAEHVAEVESLRAKARLAGFPV
ncbi:alkaline phosphatase family protein [Fontimonas sp. SYSU GA230001]|uniref:alkaline phosphatase family protein n=1 Tax=Fontimonas sp. SYSU GA230001 TaxID=3142450 RepID=UPI0032B45105